LIRELDAATAPLDDLLAIHAVEQACHAESFPGEPGRSADDAVAYLRHATASYDRYRWLAGDTGTAGLYVHAPNAVYLQLYVAPAHRRRGIGTALLAAVRERTASLGLTSLYGHHTTPAGAAFASRARAIDGQRDIRSLLGLPHASLPEPSVPDGWTLVTWTGRVPDDAVGAYVAARAALDDAPMPDGVEIPVETVERVRALEDALARRRRESRVTAALARDGRVGSFTYLGLSHGSTVADTSDTATVAGARGLGLARAVKLESLRRLRHDHPEVKLVTTTNAEENVAIRHITEQLGFTAAATFTSTVLTL
jgi:GNAT superfamily N-acetyltransferase